MKDRQNGAIARGIEEFVGMPTRGERAGFGFAIADDTGDDQIRIVERRAISVRERITQFSAFMDRAWCFRRDMTWNAVGPRELPEEASHSLAAALDIRIGFGVG